MCRSCFLAGQRQLALALGLLMITQIDRSAECAPTCLACGWEGAPRGISLEWVLYFRAVMTCTGQDMMNDDGLHRHHGRTLSIAGFSCNLHKQFVQHVVLPLVDCGLLVQLQTDWEEVATGMCSNV